MTAVTTTISTKGQVVLPKALRDRMNWTPGTRLTVEETGNGITLRAVPQYPRTKMEDVFGMVKWDGPPISIEEMDAAAREAAVRSYRRSIEGD